MIRNIVYHDSEKIVREVIQKIRDHEIVFFVGSAISFHKLIYRTVVDGEIAIRILNCLKEREPNQNHFFLAEGLGQYFDTILTTNQDPLIERALEKRSLRLLQTTQQGDKIFENGRVIIVF